MIITDQAVARESVKKGSFSPFTLLRRLIPPPLRPYANKGQATTEVALMLPIFMFFLYAFAKTFAMLILVQKMEIASFYAARRWQLESHRNVEYEGDDNGMLQQDIEKRVTDYLGYGTRIGDFLNLDGEAASLTVSRTQVWQVVTLEVNTKPVDLPYFRNKGFKFEITKYVPNRDRPIAFVLPGLS